MFTADNTTGFTEGDLDLLNLALGRLIDCGYDEKSASGRINNNWRPGENTAARSGPNTDPARRSSRTDQLIEDWSAVVRATMESDVLPVTKTERRRRSE